jgi:hypothetical protein
LATYQDGVCSDYSFNYGRRMSPTADEMLSYLKSAQENGKRIGRKELLHYNFTEPLSDGLSCLAALPIEVKHLIQSPYYSLTENGLIEEIYASCMDKDTNVFDLDLFRQKCLDILSKNEISNPDVNEKETKVDKRRGRKIRTGKKFWTVLRRVNEPLSHPFEPPPGFTDRLSPLRNDSKIKAYHMHSTDLPRWIMNLSEKKRFINNEKEKSKFTNMDTIISNTKTLESVKYIKVYQSAQNNNGDKRKSKSHLKHTEIFSISDIDTFELNNEISRIEKFGDTPIQPHPDQNIEGLTALQCLLELSVAGCLTTVKWSRTAPSQSAYASVYPELYEEIKLEVKGHIISKVFAQDRNRNLFSRKLLKHHLASIALRHMFSDCDWKALTINEMKDFAMNDSTERNTVNIDQRNALQCLNELKDSRMFEVTWEFSSSTSTTEIVQLLLTSSTNKLNLTMEEVRDIYKTSKTSLKKSLAASALHQLMGKENDWTTMSLNQMKAYLQQIHS